MVGLRDKYAKKIEEQGFRPIELSEENVQVIFHRCLAKEGASKEDSLPAELFPITNGYNLINGFNVINIPDIDFDRFTILQNKKNIDYLFGQLEQTHKQDFGKKITFRDFLANYLGKFWTTNKTHLSELLYLGVTPGIQLLDPFNYRNGDTTMLNPKIKPTLSPKDPNFPAWWEAHKAEWEVGD